MSDAPAGAGAVRQAWSTADELRDARLRFEALMPGYRAPVVHGTVLRHEDGEAEVGAANHDEHLLPAAVLALLVGWDGVTRTVEVPGALLARAVDLVAPAEAAVAYEHPNLHAWRRMLGHLAGHPACRVVAVLVASEQDPVTGPYDELVRARAAGRAGT